MKTTAISAMLLFGLAACGNTPMPAAELTDAGSPAAAANVDFGDDNGAWANDNECDDSRFEGPGMTATPLLDEDIRHDATDCRTAFEAGQLQLKP